MPPKVVLVTGVSRHLGGRVARALCAHPSVERVVGVDTVPPADGLRAGPGRVEFVRADIRNPLIGKVISSTGVDTVVHLDLGTTTRGSGGRTSMKETNVIGTMQLLAACQKAATVRRLVIKSTTAVYGTSPRDPALFTEEMEPKAAPSSGYAKDAMEVEGYARGFGRRRPDVELAVLRFTKFIGPNIDSWLASYFALPVVPTVLGFDARLQFLHEDDAVEVLRRAAVGDWTGVLNVGADGVLLLSQAIRRAGRIGVPVPAPAAPLVGTALRGAGLADRSPEQMRFPNFGRVVDTTRLHTDFGYRPRFSTVGAFDDFLRGVRPVLHPGRVGAVERALTGLLARVPVPGGRDV
ncbi:NAD-dependent epimerase/dehydratase family protein [soil metagenome]